MSADSAALGYDDSPPHAFLPVAVSVLCGQCLCTEANGNHEARADLAEHDFGRLDAEPDATANDEHLREEQP